MDLACPHSQTALIARRHGVDYVRCLRCEQVFESDDLEMISADEAEPPPAGKLLPTESASR